MRNLIAFLPMLPIALGCAVLFRRGRAWPAYALPVFVDALHHWVYGFVLSGYDASLTKKSFRCRSLLLQPQSPRFCFMPFLILACGCWAVATRLIASFIPIHWKGWLV